MALTPEDVVNKRFQPTKFREGYDQDEVDDFLDEVVVELRRLNQENEELRQRVIAGESRIAELQRAGASAPAESRAAETHAAEAPVAEAPIAAPAPETPPVAVPSYTSDPNLDPNNTNNLLQLARRLHEEHVREGIEKRDALIAEGHATAARLVSEAEATQRAQLSTLDQERAALEQRIDELRVFEREYRSKLRGHIEGLLQDLDATAAPSAPQAPVATPPAGVAEVENVQEPVPSGAVPTVPPAGFDQPQQPTGFQGFGGN